MLYTNNHFGLCFLQWPKELNIVNKEMEDDDLLIGGQKKVVDTFRTGKILAQSLKTLWMRCNITNTHVAYVPTFEHVYLCVYVYVYTCLQLSQVTY